MSDREKPVKWLEQYLGIRVGSAEHRAILKVYNDSRLCPRYTMTVNDAWCATATSAAFIATGLASIFPCVECSCENMINLAKKAGIWVENDAYVPTTGDVIMYYWDDNGIGDCTGWADHVGIVHSVNGSIIKVIEGNRADTVAYREIAINGRYIRGFITPKYPKSTSNIGPVKPASKKTVAQIAKEVMEGKWGTGDDRKNRLTAAGYSYTAVQAEVNKLAKKTTTTTSTKPTTTTKPAKKTVAQIAKEVMEGKWGNGDVRKKKLEAAGYNYKAVQEAVNKLGKTTTPKKTVAQIAKEVIEGKWGVGEDRKKKLTAAGYNYNTVQTEVNKLLRK